MPTKNPRIAVTLKPSSALVLRDLAKLSNRSRSAILADMVEQGIPVFQRVVRVMRAAQEAQRGASARVVDGLAAAQHHIERQLGLMEQDLDHRTGDLLDGLEQIHRRRAGRAERPARAPYRPPLLTGGVATHADSRGKGKRKAPLQARRARHGA